MGLIVQPENSSELAQAIIKILKDPNSYLGNPQNILKYTTKEFFAETYENLFSDLLGEDHQ